MNVASPDVLTLLSWAERLAAGQDCADWNAWCAMASDAAWKSARIKEAQRLLIGQSSPLEQDLTVSAEELAAFVEGRLAPVDSTRVEQACWQSSHQLAELLSTARFGQMPVPAAESSALQTRLVGLLPPKPQHANGKPLQFRLAPPEKAISAAKHAELLTATVAPPPIPVAYEQRDVPKWHWAAAVAAIALAIFASGAVGWLAATWQRSNRGQQPIAHGTVEQPVPLPKDDDPRAVPFTAPKEQSAPRPSDRVMPVPVPPSSNPLPATVAEQSRSDPPKQDEAKPPRLDPAAPVPKHRPPVAPPALELAFRPAQGLMLVDAAPGGKWRTAPGHFAISRPTRMLSLAESWSDVDVPGVGTLVWEGTTEATLTSQADGTLEVQLHHGRLGIEGLRPGAELRLVTGDAMCTARGVTADCVFAIVNDPRSSGLLVPRGSVAIDDLQVAAGQMLRWQDSLLQPPLALTNFPTAPGSQAAAAPPAMNPWDLSWLQPPDESSRKQWRSVYGRVADRLSAVEDVGAELAKLAASTREPRQAALVARWSVAATEPANRPQQIWASLIDRRTPVRVAGVKCLLEPPPGDPRLQDNARMLQEKIGAIAAGRVNEWLATAWQSGGLPQAQALELAQHLQHEELAVRQIAVTLLELHTAAIVQQTGAAPPAYDAAAPASRRAAAQADWNLILQQLYTPTRKGPTLLNPGLQPQRPAAPNAAPGAS